MNAQEVSKFLEGRMEEAAAYFHRDGGGPEVAVGDWLHSLARRVSEVGIQASLVQELAYGVAVAVAVDGVQAAEFWSVVTDPEE